ncbi:hypothetical protein A2U01_0068513 [Trifolium medium]|uniref:Uncharacterized protein n=1 Tax=Trifolium medium TaxID=97028 RepID=A0A392SFQ1_9FABA|nr:hypothetical protein [Trifolium medium]
MTRLDRTSIERVMVILVGTTLAPAPSAVPPAPRAIPGLGEHVLDLLSAPRAALSAPSAGHYSRG